MAASETHGKDTQHGVMPTARALLGIPQWASVSKPVLGMLHMPPLAGSPGYEGSLEAVKSAMLRDAEALAEEGVHGLMLENFGDVPFFPARVPACTVAQMTALALEVRSRFEVPLGINVLRNDGRSALAVAQAVGAELIRVNVLCGARVTDQGIIEGIAHDLLRDRAMLRAESIAILADVDVKHSAPLAERPLENEVTDTIHRGRADAVVVSGRGTGQAVNLDHLHRVKSAAGRSPVFVGSGVSAENLGQFLPFVDGLIVGTAFKREGISTNPVDRDRVRAFLQAYRARLRG